MEPASLLIDDASDLAMDGKVTEAIAKYREALAALDKVEAEHPDRVQSPEFATLRNKRAYVNAAMDSIILAQARQNAKSVAVSDTTELERKFAEEKAALERKKLEEKAALKRKKSGKEASGEEKKSDSENPAATKEKAAGADTKVDETEVEVAEKTPKGTSGQTAAAAEKPAVAVQAPKVEAPKSLVSAGGSGAIAKKTPSVQPKNRREQAIRDIQAGDYDAAMLVIDEMLAEKPNGAAALNLRAICQVKQGLFKDAERTLDRAIRSNPRDFNAYYNMAYLVLQTKRDGGKNMARRYYETGRAFGGPVDERLKEAVK
jgi:tetratricopeptide (TPR) repeat protein